MNFNAFVGQIQLELNDYTSRSKTRIEAWTNKYHRRICQKRPWSFLVEISDAMTIGVADLPFNIETGLEVVTVTTPAQNILSLFDVTDGSYYEVKKIEVDQFRRLVATESAEAGSPSYWAYLTNKNIIIYQLGEDRDFVFRFQKKLSTYATGSTDPLLIPDEYIDVLNEIVRYKAYQYKSDDRAGSALEEYNDLFSAMISAESNKSGIIYDTPQSSFQIFPKLIPDS